MDRRRIAALWGVVFLTIALVAQGSPSRAEIPVVFLDGRGHGHGVGLSQWGAESLARHGRSWQEILQTFYPGTGLGTASGPVRVAVFSSGNSSTTLQFPNGGEVRSRLIGDQTDGFPVRVGPGGSVRITFDGRYRVEKLAEAQSAESGDSAHAAESSPGQECIPLVNCPTTTTTTQPGGGGCLLCSPTTTTPRPVTTTTRPPQSTTTAPKSSTSSTTGSRRGAAVTGAPVWAVPAGSNGATTVVDRGRGYRGLLEVSAGAGPLRVINQVDVETYLKGMAEVPSNWPLQAIAAQTVAARTWALRAMQASGELCDHERCQVYVGITREAPGQNAAVDATRGVVVSHGGALATTVYSASAGGVTANTFEGFGTPDGRYPYLRTVRYETDDPRAWRVVAGLGDVAARFGYPGTVDDVRISDEGPSGRALQVTLVGSAGERAVDGREFARSLGLRSTLFRPTVGTADKAPALPDDAGALDQVLPDDAAAVKAAARQPSPPRLPVIEDGRVPTVELDPIEADTAARVGMAGLLGVAALGALTAVAASRTALTAGLPFSLPFRAGVPHSPHGRATNAGTGRTRAWIRRLRR